MTTTTVTGPGPAPQPPAEGEEKAQAFDHLGNPICLGCHEGGFMWAARQNSGKGTCGCPVDRRLPDVESRAEALRIIRDALDVIDDAGGHRATCGCTLCRVYRVLRGERVL